MNDPYFNQQFDQTIRSMESSDSTDPVQGHQIDASSMFRADQPRVLSKFHENLLKPLPLIPKGSAFSEGLEVPKWRQKNAILASFHKTKEQIQTPNEQQQIKQEEKEYKAEIKIEDSETQGADNDVKTVEQVQEKLNKYSDQICIINFVQIEKAKYPRYFKYQIYESYKADNLKEIRKQLELYMKISWPTDTLTLDPVYFDGYFKYLQKDLQTQFPSYVNEKNLLTFDSNFECGNLDSAYVVNENEYNLLMKVDTNTRGSSFWFYFQAKGKWRGANQNGRTIKFNILNFTKQDIKYFYSHGMNIMTQVLVDADTPDINSWQKFKCTDIDFFNNQDLEKDGQKRFCQLSFKYTFDIESTKEEFPTIRFAYCLPYSYFDLLTDLKTIKYSLLDPSLNGGTDSTITYFSGEKLNSEIYEQIDDMQKQSQTAQQVIERNRLNYYEMQHQELRNRGLKVIKFNSIEKEFIADVNYDKFKATNFGKRNSTINQTQKVDAQNGEEFEITASHIIYKQEIICKTLGGLPIYQLTIQSANSNKGSKKKRVIYISARAHAGETHSSFVMQKLIQELCLAKIGEKSKYETLLQNYVIKLVPMINVDGVVIGNARTSLLGLDLNRRWTQPNPLIHPEVYFLKRELLKAHKQYDGIQIFCDLHGHNRNPNAFVYGCHKAANEGFLSWTKTRLLPKIIASVTPIFDFKECRFKIDRCKLNTARVVCWNDLKITNSFTLEVSMFGKLQETSPYLDGPPPSQDFSKSGKQQIVQFNIDDLHSLGVSLLKALVQYNQIEPELEQEFQMTGGWLKVQKLNVITGKAARDKIEERNINVKLVKRSNTTAIKAGGVVKKSSKSNTSKVLKPQKTIQIDEKNTTNLTQTTPQDAKIKIEQHQYKHSPNSFPLNSVNINPSSHVLANFFANQQTQPQIKIDHHQAFPIAQPFHQNTISSGIFGIPYSIPQQSNTLKSPPTPPPQTHDQQNAGTPRQVKKLNWRDFFEQTELEPDIIEENQDSDDNGGSESDPSENNIDAGEFLEMIETVFSKDQEVSFKDLHHEIEVAKSPQMKQEKQQEEKQEEEIITQIPPEVVHIEKDIDGPYNFIIKSHNASYSSIGQKGHEDNALGKSRIQANLSSILHEDSNENDSLNDQFQSPKQNRNLQYYETSPKGIQNTSFSRQRSPITCKPTSTHYAGWFQSKQQNNAKLQNSQDQGNQYQRLSKLRQSAQSQRNPNQAHGNGMSNLFDPQKQKILSDILVSGGYQRLQEIEKNIFSTPNRPKNIALSNQRKMKSSQNFFQKGQLSKSTHQEETPQLKQQSLYVGGKCNSTTNVDDSEGFENPYSFIRSSQGTLNAFKNQILAQEYGIEAQPNRFNKQNIFAQSLENSTSVLKNDILQQYMSPIKPSTSHQSSPSRQAPQILAMRQILNMSSQQQQRRQNQFNAQLGIQSKEQSLPYIIQNNHQDSSRIQSEQHGHRIDFKNLSSFVGIMSQEKEIQQIDFNPHPLAIKQVTNRVSSINKSSSQTEAQKETQASNQNRNSIQIQNQRMVLSINGQNGIVLKSAQIQNSIMKKAFPEKKQIRNDQIFKFGHEKMNKISQSVKPNLSKAQFFAVNKSREQPGVHHQLIVSPTQPQNTNKQSEFLQSLLKRL